MSSQKSINSPEPDASDTNSDVSEASLRKELGELVNNDTEAPYQAQRASLFFEHPQGGKAGGYFPSGVAFFAIAIVCSTIFLCTGHSKHRSPWFDYSVVTLFMGSALIAQRIHANHMNNNNSMS